MEREDSFDTEDGRIFQIIQREETAVLWSPEVHFGPDPNRLCTMPKMGEQLKFLYVVEDLGRGADGNVVLACTKEAKATCAIKFFYRHMNETVETRNMRVEKEKAVWHKVYPELEKKVRVERWRGQDALVMPYLSQAVERDNDATRTAVQKTLKRYADNHIKHDDVRWANIGFYDQDGELAAVLFDCVRVTEMPNWDQKDKENWVRECLEKLKVP